MQILGITILILVLLTLGIWIFFERSFLPHSSTRRFWNLSALPAAKKIEGYLYAARPALYLKPATWAWFQRIYVPTETGDTYHGKVLPKSGAVRLVSLKMPIHAADLEHVIPYPTARSLILADPLPSLAITDCPCRAQRKNPCQPGNVCMVVGEPFVSFTLDHHPGSRRITVEEALRILEEEEARGHIHTAWFKDAMHNRFYTICNCCPCCCLGMESYQRGVPRMTHSGYLPSVDPNLCANCGACVDICFFNAMQAGEDTAVCHEDLCMGCGLCVSHCPSQAIALEPAPHRGVPLDTVLMS